MASALYDFVLVADSRVTMRILMLIAFDAIVSEKALCCVCDLCVRFLARNERVWSLAGCEGSVIQHSTQK